MKILHTVQFYPPSIGGMQEVVKQLSEHLVKLGHEVVVATAGHPNRNENELNGVKVVGFNLTGNIVNGISGDATNYQNYLLNSDFDIITNFAAQQWATDLMLPILDQINAKKVFVPTGFSGLGLPEYRDYFEQMKVWMRKYDATVFLSNNYRDINFARDNEITNWTIIPNGASEEEFLGNASINIRKVLGIPEDHFLILHVGSHSGEKGHAEAIAIFKKAKIKKTTFLLIGNRFGFGCFGSCHVKQFLDLFSVRRWAEEKRLMIVSLPRKETVAAYQAANLFLFPSNIECSPIVLFECMASKTPFLTSDVGNAAEIIEWSGGGILLPTSKDNNGYSRVNVNESADLLENVYADFKKRESLQLSGFKAWQNKFTWVKIAQEYEELYRRLIKVE